MNAQESKYIMLVANRANGRLATHWWECNPGSTQSISDILYTS